MIIFQVLFLLALCALYINMHERHDIEAIRNLVPDRGLPLKIFDRCDTFYTCKHDMQDMYPYSGIYYCTKCEIVVDYGDYL